MRSAARTARGPSRAPARFVTPRSIGTPTSAMSRPAKLSAAAFGRRGAEGRRLRERPFAPLALELGLRHALEFGVVERPALGVGVAAAQIRELVLVHGSLRQMCSR